MKGAKGKGAAKRDTLKPIDDRKVGKKKAAASKGKTKAAKDPNKPKRPPSAFFVFLEEFRITFKKEKLNNKAVSAVGKAGGEKWKSMSAAEKAPYEAKAAKRKTEYEKLMKAYNKKQRMMLKKNQISQNLKWTRKADRRMMKQTKTKMMIELYEGLTIGICILFSSLGLPTGFNFQVTVYDYSNVIL